MKQPFEKNSQTQGNVPIAIGRRVPCDNKNNKK